MHLRERSTAGWLSSGIHSVLVLWPGLRVPWVRAFCGKVLSLSLFFFCPSLWLSHVSSFRLSSGRSGPVLTLSSVACASLFSPCLLVVDMGVCAASPLGELPLGLYSVGFNYLFFLPVMWPSVLPRLATNSAVRVFPGVWKLLSF